MLLREALGLSQETLADKSSENNVTIFHYEQKTQSALEKADKLLKALGIGLVIGNGRGLPLKSQMMIIIDTYRSSSVAYARKKEVSRMPKPIEKPPNIVRVHRPVLTPEEREKRMEAVKAAAINLLIAAEKAHMLQALQSAQQEAEKPAERDTPPC